MREFFKLPIIRAFSNRSLRLSIARRRLGPRMIGHIRLAGGAVDTALTGKRLASASDSSDPQRAEAAWCRDNYIFNKLPRMLAQHQVSRGDCERSFGRGDPGVDPRPALRAPEWAVGRGEDRLDQIRGRSLSADYPYNVRARVSILWGDPV